MKALITASFDPEFVTRLRRHMDVEHDDWRASKHIYFDGLELAARIRGSAVDVLIVEADLVHDEVLDNCRLRIIGCCRGDPLNIGVAKATAQGVPVIFTPGRNADAVADLTLAYMLSLARHVFRVNTMLKTGQMRFSSTKDYLKVYEEYGGFELGGATVGIIGFGAIGKAVARRLRGFGSTVLVFDPFVSAAACETLHARATPLDDLLQHSDILTVHCPESPQTYGLIGAAQLRALKRGSLVLNLARASIVDEDALYEALRDGHIAGAALDVFRDEPVQPDNRFVQLPNVLCSPHLGGATRDVVRHQSQMIVDDIEALLSGGTPQHIVNPDALKAFR